MITKNILPLLALIFFLADNSTAKPLTAADMEKCGSIAIIPGTYDPFTNGHEAMGKEITSKLPFDCVVYLPTQDTPHKISSPFQSRYEMVAAALRDSDSLFYPVEGDLALSPKDYVKKLRELSRNKKVYTVLGSDLSPKNYMYWINRFRLDPDGYIITGREEEAVQVARSFNRKPHHVIHPDNSLSSTSVRKWFQANDQIYFAGDRSASMAPNDMIHPRVSEYIVAKGMYFASPSETTRSVVQIATSSVQSAANKLGIFDAIRDQLVKKHSQPNLTSLEIDGKTYPLKKHLGAGLTADAYIINYNGEDLVIKIANQRPRSPSSIQAETRVSRWLDQRTGIRVPEIIGVDPEGKWKISRFVGGESLGEYLRRTNGVMEGSVEAEVRKSVDEMLAMSRATNVKLDLSVDNLKIWNGKVYLIDPGPIPPTANHPQSYNEFYQRWTSQLKIKGTNPCAFALRSLITN